MNERPRLFGGRGLGEANSRIATGEGASEPRNRRIEIRIVPKPG